MPNDAQSGETGMGLSPELPIHTGRNRRLYVGVASAAVIAAAILLTELAKHRVSAAPQQEAQATPAVTVTSQYPRPEQWAETVEAPGGIFAWQEASIGTQIGGYQLIDVRVNVGDHVRRGQILARFDPALLKAEEAELVANYEQADANRKRALALQASGGISAQDILGFVTQARATEALLSSKRLQLRYTDVLAPDDGTISSRTATLGAVVPVGQELFRLIRQDRLEWRGELTAEQLIQVRVGQQVRLHLPDGSDAAGIVRATAPALDTTSRIGIVYADLAPGTNARAGMYGDGRIVLKTTAALALPAEGIAIRDGRNYVFKLQDIEGNLAKVTRVAITTGRHTKDLAEITAGATDLDRLVVKGAGFLNDGDIVRVIDEQAEPGNSAALTPMGGQPPAPSGHRP
jgi:RND family efflux transporter MFP subunit